MSLSCSSNQTDLTITWTKGSTQLVSASSTGSLTHTINNITRSESGNYTCTLLKAIGSNGFTITRIGTVSINVQCHCSKYCVSILPCTVFCIPLSHVATLSSAAAYTTNTAAPTPTSINSSHAAAIFVGSVSGGGLLVLLAIVVILILCIVFRCQTNKGIFTNIFNHDVSLQNFYYT